MVITSLIVRYGIIFIIDAIRFRSDKSDNVQLGISRLDKMFLVTQKMPIINSQWSNGAHNGYLYDGHMNIENRFRFLNNA